MKFLRDTQRLIRCDLVFDKLQSVVVIGNVLVMETGDELMVFEN